MIHSYTLDKPRDPRDPHITGDYVWDLDMVLYLFRKWPNNKDLSLFDLSRKTATLIMLTSAIRQTDIVNLNLSCAYRVGRKYSFHLRRPTKTFNSKRQLKCFSEKKVCPYNAIWHYISRTSKIRWTHFLLVTTNTHQLIAPATLSQRMKSVLSEAGMDVKVFHLHTKRSAAVSKFAFKTQSLDKTLKLGEWHTTSSFYKYYLQKPKYFGDRPEKLKDKRIVHKDLPRVLSVVQFAAHKLCAAIKKSHSKRTPWPAPWLDALVHQQEGNFIKFTSDHDIKEDRSSTQIQWTLLILNKWTSHWGRWSEQRKKW